MADPYEPSAAVLDGLLLAFRDHPTSADQAQRLAEVRRLAYELALRLVRLCPPRRELERAVTLAGAAVARGESPGATAPAPPPQT